MKKGNLRTGIPVTKVIECDPKDFKNKIKEIEKSGIVIKSIKSEPIRYRYSVNYYEERLELSEESWKDAPGSFYGLYQISSLGRIRSVRVLKEYERYILTDGEGKRHNVKVETLMKQVFP